MQVNRNNGAKRSFWTSHLGKAFLAMAAAAVTACGGGGEPTVNVQASQVTVRAAAAGDSANFNDMDAATLDALITSGLSPDAQVASAKPLSASGATTNDTAPAPPPACDTFYLGSLAARCIHYGDGLESNYQNADASGIMPVNPYCKEISVGELVYGLTPVPGSVACYQFPIANVTTLNFQMQLPAGIVGTAELYRIHVNGAGYPQARVMSPASPLTGTTTVANVRMVLVLRTSNGNGGQVFGLGINTTVPQPLPSNSAMINARSIDMNEEINDAIAGPLDSAYYFFPLRVGQTTASIIATFNAANLQVGYRAAQKTGPNAYTVGAETILTSAQSNSTPATFTSPYPANTASTTSPAGIMLRITGTNPAGALNQVFGVRAGVTALNYAGFNITNTENISRWFPTSPTMLQAANYVTTGTITVKDANGAWVKNQPVQVSVLRYVNDQNSIQNVTYKTNFEGKLSMTPVLNTAGTAYPVTINFAAKCAGDLTYAYNYGPGGTPSDHWDGTAQKGSFKIAFVGTSTTSTLPFTRICSETYRGYN